jgi:hypothetical protein
MWFGVAPRMDTNSDMSSQEIGLHAQIMVTLLDPIVKIIGRGRGLNDHSINMRIFTLIMNKIVI